MGVMRADLVLALHEAGFPAVDVRTVLSPAWSTDWISEAGRRKLAAGGIAPPGRAPVRTAGPVPLQLGPTLRTAACPLCGSPDTEELSEFGATACKALRRCRSCSEPFEHVKEI
jgi:ring-1,2-phenylacetyl-CoA epoxidase subunit PaaD